MGAQQTLERPRTRRKPIHAYSDRHPPRAYSINETARLLGVGRTSVYKLIKEKKLEDRYVAGCHVVLARSISRLLDLDE